MRGERSRLVCGEMNKGVLIRGVAILAVVWLVVWGVTSWTGKKKATPEKVEAMIEEAEMEDLSEWEPSEVTSTQREERRARLAEVGETLNKLDLRQRRVLDEGGMLLGLFFKLTREEKLFFIEETFTKTAQRLMESFDEMTAEERRRMVDRSVQDMASGPGGEALARLKEEDPEILNMVIKEGFRAYYQGASADTKMSLLPFMDAVGEVVQGFQRPGAGGL